MKKILNYKGFTLIELLVVITLIAILAVAILAAINPVEQRRKAVDTGFNSAAAQLISAYDRYFVAYGCYPAQYGATTPGVCDAMPGAGNITSLAADVTKMQAAGEIKDTSLATKLTAAPSSYLYKDGTDAVHFCYNPTSKNFDGLANFSGTAMGSGTTHFCIPDSQR